MQNRSSLDASTREKMMTAIRCMADEAFDRFLLCRYHRYLADSWLLPPPEGKPDPDPVAEFCCHLADYLRELLREQQSQRDLPRREGAGEAEGN